MGLHKAYKKVGVVYLEIHTLTKMFCYNVINIEANEPSCSIYL
jgi:hypothetical protein